MIDLNFSGNSLKPDVFQKCLLGFRQLKGRRDLGFLELPKRSQLWASAKGRADQLRDQGELVVLGIGGSSLGIKVLRDFAKLSRREKLWVIESPEEEGLQDLVQSLDDLRRVHWVVISKSGSTLESLAQVSWLVPELKRRGLLLKEQMTVITELKSSPLYNWAQDEGIPCLEVPLDVGGRFSVLSPVGSFVASWLELDLEDLKAGAFEALEAEELVSQLAALSLESFQRKEWLTLFWAYGQKFHHLGLWWQQLWSESLAKINGPRVSTPMVLLGPIDQHSILQQVIEGERDKWVWMWKARPDLEAQSKTLISPFESDWSLDGCSLQRVCEVQYEATFQSIKRAGVSAMKVRPRDASVRELGFIFMAFQLLIGALGEVLRINAFDQPGVEKGKLIAKKIFSEDGRQT